MPDFNKGSTFNKDANFQGVKFGADAPLLETELNELQDIQTEARADIIRDTIPSGFVQLGELDFDYMLNNENCVKMKTDSVAYVNGYKIKIPKDTIVDIGKAPEKDAREDLLFLEVWKEEVTKDSVLTVAGGEGQAQINNPILDDRVGQETSRRIALKWRIRHIPNFDFNISWSQANEGADKYIGLSSNGSSYPNLIPQGGKSTPTTKLSWFKVLQNRSLQPYVTKEGLLNPTSGDPGLWSNMCYKDRVEETKIELNTLDGFVYAIPMFRLYRKPSCGKAIPFEYQKINPKVDYSKFTDLMKEEKVERVISETISGRSLVNLIKTTKYSGTHNACLEYNIPVKENTKYTVIVEDYSDEFYNSAFIITSSVYLTSKPSNGDTLYLNTVSNGKGTEHIVSKITPSRRELNRFIGVITTKQGEIYLGLRSGGQNDKGFKYSKARIIEGDWLDKEIPEYFTGLKSLGEDEGNLITVKNGILNESSYDPDTGTPKLNTVDGVNHITSDNLIMPNIEAQVKRGETKLSDLNSFDKVDNMVGDEVVDFTKIKGRTLQNLVNQNANLQNYKLTGYYVDRVLCDLSKLKQNVTYTLIYTLELKENTSGENYNRVTIGLSNNMNNLEKELKNWEIVPTLGKRKIMCSFSISDLSDYKYLSLRPIRRTTLPVEGEYIVINTSEFLILEGDYTSTPLDQIPYIEGIKSVGENEDNKVIVKRTGKNLFNLSKWKGIGFTRGTGSVDLDMGTISITSTSRDSFTDSGVRSDGYMNMAYKDLSLDVKPNTTYTLTFDRKIIGSSNALIFLNEFDICYKLSKLLSSGDTQFTFTTGSNTYHMTLRFGVTEVGCTAIYSNIQLKEGEVHLLSQYEPYKEYKQEITLKEPLRSLPNGVCDTIEGNKVIRRCRKAIVTHNSNVSIRNNGDESTTISFNFYETINIAKTSNANAICDKFIFEGVSTNGTEGFGIGASGETYFEILRSRLSTPDISGVKEWLQSNPITVIYELTTPIEEPIEPNYDKESIKTYQLDEPLRALPNGVKDEIIDGKLIRRCGEVIVDSNSNITRRNMGDESTTVSFHCVVSNIVLNSDLICNLFQKEQNSTNGIEGIGVGANSEIFIEILRSRLASNDVNGFKTWLKENPLKVIYELETPIEIPLKEVLPSKADFSLERQFKYSDSYLLELPNGVKDTVENGKVTRRVKKIVLNGSEDWADSSSLVLANTIGFRVIPSDKKVNTEIFCDKFKYVHHNSLTTLDEEFITGQGTTSQVYIRIAKSRLSSPDSTGFKAWLSDNPITIMYELTTPTTEELSGNNNRYCPYHKEDNTYCGSMYVGDGANDVIVENGLKNENVIIDTPFRSITNKEVVTDCKYKKSVDGYDTSYITSNGNLLDDSVYKGFKLKEAKIHFQPVRLTPGKYSLRIVFTDGTVVPNSNVCIFIFDEKKLPIMGLATNGVLYVDWEVAKKGKYLVLARNDMGISVYGEKVIQNIIVAKSETFVMDISDYSPIEKAFENTEENDIEDLRHLTSLVGFNYEQILNESFDKLLIGEL